MSVGVDPRVELLSILFRLAGNPEYGRGRVESYTQDVDRHFDSFRNHAAVAGARKMRQTRGVGFDAPMALAVHLTDTERLRTKVPLAPWPASLDTRWTAEGVESFLADVRPFVRDAAFRKFFDGHRALYEKAEGRMRSLLEKDAHLEWFPEFFGQRSDARFTVVPGMLNGPNCYGPHCRTADGVDELYCILGVWQTDLAGRPVFSRDVLPTIVHEFCHSYTNALVDRHAPELEIAGKAIYDRVKKAMSSQAYGNWRTMLYESMVRSCVVRYRLRYDGKAAAKREIEAQKQRQFVWIGELSDLLGQYEADRSKYANLEAFAPRIVQFFKDYSDRVEQEERTREARRPKVVSMRPANGATDVDPGLARIEVLFDRPMQADSWSMVGGGPHFPKPTDKPAYDAKGTTWSAAVKLDPEWDYQFRLNSDWFTGFRSAEGEPLPSVVVRFRTGRAR